VGGQAFADGSEPIFEVLSKFGKVGGWFVGECLIRGALVLARVCIGLARVIVVLLVFIVFVYVYVVVVVNKRRWRLWISGSLRLRSRGCAGDKLAE